MNRLALCVIIVQVKGMQAVPISFHRTTPLASPLLFSLLLPLLLPSQEHLGPPWK